MELNSLQPSVNIPSEQRATMGCAAGAPLGAQQGLCGGSPHIGVCVAEQPVRITTFYVTAAVGRQRKGQEKGRKAAVGEQERASTESE